jgi:hypothetical protein
MLLPYDYNNKLILIVKSECEAARISTLLVRTGAKKVQKITFFRKKNKTPV